MVWRAQFGNRGGVYGCWVSKPGIDVTTALPGQFLLDTSSQVFQSVLKGDSLVGTEGSATVGAGTVFSTSVTLPGAFAGFSNLMMHATYYMVQNSGAYFSDQNISNTYLTYHITSGVLVLNVTFRNNGGTGTSSVSFSHRASYTIFRGQF